MMVNRAPVRTNNSAFIAMIADEGNWNFKFMFSLRTCKLELAMLIRGGKLTILLSIQTINGSKFVRLRPNSISRMVLWTMPNQGSIKINTDGSYIDYNDKAGIGGYPEIAMGILEKTRWTVKKDAGVDFSIDEVIAVMKDGTIRIGLNTGGGVATFAGVKAWCAVLATSSVLVEQLEKVIVGKPLKYSWIGIRSRRSPYDRSSRRRQHDHPFVLGLQATISPHSNSHNGGITIINVSSRDLVERALMQQHVQDYFNGGLSPNSSDDSQPASELFDDQRAYTEEKEDDAILLGYFKTRIHCVADGVNNPTETKEICAICQAEFEHEESIGTLGCGHEYHTGCIKQWLLRKKDCPMCRASVLP
ncbi:hypothetical protein KY284_014258 [Solanum tuberosum]|nr:hypothetical protein KY284_014258 [Solanum tuberosum]